MSTSGADRRPVALVLGVTAATLLLIARPGPVIADRVTWENGIVNGHVTRTATRADAVGTFFFNPGDPSGLGLDFAPLVNQANPGAFQATYTPGATGIWDANFAAPDASVIAGSGQGIFTYSPTRLTFEGPLDFNAPGANAIPEILTDHRVFGDTVVSNIVLGSPPMGSDADPILPGYDFAGPFSFTSELDLCVVITRSASATGQKALDLYFARAAGTGCSVTQLALDLGSGNQADVAPTSPACPTSADTWSAGGTAQPTIALATPVAVGASWTTCITDSLGADWNTGQSVTATLACGPGSLAAPAQFDRFFDLQTDTTIDVSEATIGLCAQDDDRDGAPNSDDNCPTTPNAGQEDGDGDGVGGLCDVCPDAADPNQADSNQDGVGDACEAECDDGLDNDGDGVADYPDDADCRDPDDGDEAGPACLGYLETLVKSEGPMLERLVSEETRAELARYLETTEKGALLQLQLGIARYQRCHKIPRIDRDIPTEICLQSPDLDGPPQKCPPLECEIDQPPCWGAYPFQARATVPVEALVATALWARGRLTLEQLDEKLAALEKKGTLRLDLAPSRVRKFPALGLLTGTGVGVGLLALGALIGGRLRGRRVD